MNLIAKFDLKENYTKKVPYCSFCELKALYYFPNVMLKNVIVGLSLVDLPTFDTTDNHK